MKLDPTVHQLLRFGLLGFGALMAISAVVNMIAACQLIEAAEEQSLGITRNEFVGTYAVMLASGAAVLVVAWRWRK